MSNIDLTFDVYNGATMSPVWCYGPPLGYQVSFDFTVPEGEEYHSPSSTNVEFVFDCRGDQGGEIEPPPPPPPDTDWALGLYNGNTYQVELSPWDLDFTYGQEVVGDLLTTKVSNITLDSAFNGETFEFNQLSTRPGFSVEFPQGDTGDRSRYPWNNWLSTRGPIHMGSRNYTGTHFEAGDHLVTQVGIQIDFQQGSYSESEMTGRTRVSIDPQFWTGDSSETFLGTTDYLEARALTGQESLTTLKIFPASDEDMSVNFWQGDASEISELVTVVTLEADFQQGDSLHSVLKTHAASYFEPQFWGGYWSSTDLDTRPAWLPEFDSYVGWVLDSGLATQPSFNIRAQGGNHSSFDLDIHPAVDLESLGFRGGDSVTTSVSIARNLGDQHFYTGQSSSFELDFDPNIYAYNGNAFGLDTLSTSSGVSIDIQTGNSVALDLDTRASAGMGVFDGYTGTHLQTSKVSTQETIFMSVLFRNSTDMSVNQEGSEVSFDLTMDQDCCPHTPDMQYMPDGSLRLELNNFDPPELKYYGDKQIFESSLSARPRFQVDFYHGTALSAQDYSIDIQPRFFNGSSANASFESERTVQLCYGNFIPDAEHMDVELDYVYDRECDSIPGYTGNTSSVFIESSPNPSMHIIQGNTMVSSLTTKKTVWRFIFWNGDESKFKFPFEPEFGISTGNHCYFEFERDEYSAHNGQSMDTNLTLKYNVEFLEEGCLDNEYIPMTEDGDLVANYYKPVPMELEIYKHEIKARCF